MTTVRAAPVEAPLSPNHSTNVKGPSTCSAQMAKNQGIKYDYLTL